MNIVGGELEHAAGRTDPLHLQPPAFMSLHPCGIPGRARTVCSLQVWTGGTRRKKNPPHPPRTHKCPALPSCLGRNSDFFLFVCFLGDSPSTEVGKSPTQAGNAAHGTQTRLIVSKRAAMSPHLPRSNPCRLLPEGSPTPAPGGGQAPLAAAFQCRFSAGLLAAVGIFDSGRAGTFTATWHPRSNLELLPGF